MRRLRSPTGSCCGTHWRNHATRSARRSRINAATFHTTPARRLCRASLKGLTEATLDGTRREVFTALSTVPLLIIVDLGTRKLPPTASEDLLELIMQRYERASTFLTCNRLWMTGEIRSAIPRR